MEIKIISYSGNYPNLCSGKLIVSIDAKEWVFLNHCMSSGGGVWFDSDWSEHIEGGPWGISNWPEGYPEEAKDQTTKLVNDQISWGCCGGCV